MGSVWTKKREAFATKNMKEIIIGALRKSFSKGHRLSSTRVGSLLIIYTDVRNESTQYLLDRPK
jgi:hypothetical protein